MIGEQPNRLKHAIAVERRETRASPMCTVTSASRNCSPANIIRHKRACESFASNSE